MILNRYPAWKYILVVLVIVIGAIYAAPNLFGSDPAIQVSASLSSLQEGLAGRVDEAVKNSGVDVKAVEPSESHVLIRLNNLDDQREMKDYLEEFLGPNNYTVAPNLASATPEWLRGLGALPMYLGLDLRGGVHFLLQVDMDTAIARRFEAYREGIRSQLRQEKIYYSGVVASNDELRVQFKEAQARDQAFTLIRNEFADLTFSTEDLSDTFLIRGSMRDDVLRSERQNALTQNIITLRNRVNQLGVAEPVIQAQGEDRIVVQLPGIQDTTKAKEIIGSTATLEYRLVHGTYTDWVNAAQNNRVPVNARMYYDRNKEPVLLNRSIIVTGENIINASSGFEQQNGSPAVFVTLDGKGASRMSKISSANIGKPMAVVYIKTTYDTKEVDGKQVSTKKVSQEVISIATIRDQLSKQFQTTGLEMQEANDLALLLRAGALKAPMQFIEERTVGPSLGADNIERGFNSVIIGLVLVMIFMAVYYRVFGLVADLALALNLVLIIAVLSMLQATLTMPGIAGIVLTVGMAVDANVLIFERIREELRNGNSLQASIHAGYEKAFSTIADANITTLIAAVILFGFGTGPIKGFAVTLMIGIVSSMFTAIIGTRAVINLIYGGKQVKKLAI